MTLEQAIEIYARVLMFRAGNRFGPSEGSCLLGCRRPSGRDVWERAPSSRKGFSMNAGP